MLKCSVHIGKIFIPTLALSLWFGEAHLSFWGWTRCFLIINKQWNTISSAYGVDNCVEMSSNACTSMQNSFSPINFIWQQNMLLDFPFLHFIQFKITILNMSLYYCSIKFLPNTNDSKDIFPYCLLDLNALWNIQSDMLFIFKVDLEEVQSPCNRRRTMSKFFFGMLHTFSDWHQAKNKKIILSSSLQKTVLEGQIIQIKYILYCFNY